VDEEKLQTSKNEPTPKSHFTPKSPKGTLVQYLIKKGFLYFSNLKSGIKFKEHLLHSTFRVKIL